MGIVERGAGAKLYKTDHSRVSKHDLFPRGFSGCRVLYPGGQGQAIRGLTGGQESRRRDSGRKGDREDESGTTECRLFSILEQFSSNHRRWLPYSTSIFAALLRVAGRCEPN